MTDAILLIFDPSPRGTAWWAHDIDAHEPIRAGALELPRGPDLNAYTIEDVRDDARAFALRVSRPIVRLIERFEPVAFAVETPLGAQSYQAATGLARAHQAVVDAIAIGAPELFDSRHVHFLSAHGGKWAATGRKMPKGGKAAVHEAVANRFGRTRMAELASNAKSEPGREGIYDCAALALLAMRLPGVKALRTSVGELAGTVQLSNRACPRYTDEKRCGCPEGRCWYDEQLARRAALKPALSPEAWLRSITSGSAAGAE